MPFYCRTFSLVNGEIINKANNRNPRFLALHYSLVRVLPRQIGCKNRLFSQREPRLRLGQFAMPTPGRSSPSAANKFRTGSRIATIPVALKIITAASSAPFSGSPSARLFSDDAQLFHQFIKSGPAYSKFRRGDGDFSRMFSQHTFDNFSFYGFPRLLERAKVPAGHRS
jgi:hypothetical protein